MRNHLAEDVLNGRMLQLFQELQSSVPGGDPSLNGVIELLTKTSPVLHIFRDQRPIRSSDDERVKKLEEFHGWLKDWESNASQPSELLSQECRKDWSSTILGFVKCVRNILRDYPDAEIIPALFNTDLLENSFGCQRSLVAGIGCNPTVIQYGRSINTIILSTNTVSKKANAGHSSTAVPYQFAKTTQPGGPLSHK